MKAYAVSIKNEPEVAYFAAESCSQAKSVLHGVLVSLGWRWLRFTDLVVKRAFEFDDLAALAEFPRSIHREAMERRQQQ